MRVLLVIIVLSLSSAYSIEADVKTSEGNIIQLTAVNFTATLDKSNVLLVQWYSPSCGHCTRFSPIYREISAIVSPLGVIVAQVDATVEVGIADQHGIRSYPTLKLYRDGNAEVYKGPLTIESVISFIKSSILPDSKEIHSIEDLESMLSSKVGNMNEDVSIVLGLFGVEDNMLQLKQNFLLMAKQHRNEFNFVHFNPLSVDMLRAKQISNISNCPGISIIHFPVGQEKWEVIGTSMTQSNMTTSDDMYNFIDSNRFPTITRVTRLNYSNLIRSIIPLALVITSGIEDIRTQDALRQEFQAAIKFKGKLHFAWVDGRNIDVSEMGFSGKVLPLFIIQYNHGKRKFPLKESTAISTSIIVNHSESVLSGTATPFVNSAEPSSTDEKSADNKGVIQAVGKTFENILKTNYDCLLLLYSPACHLCKQALLLFDKLGTLSSEFPTIAFVKMDGTTNDIPIDGWDYEGFPTIFYKISNSNTPVMYDGTISIKKIFEFMKKHSSTPLDTDLEEIAFVKQFERLGSFVDKIRAVFKKNRELVQENEDLKRRVARMESYQRDVASSNFGVV